MIPTLTGKLIRDRGASFRETMENCPDQTGTRDAGLGRCFGNRGVAGCFDFLRGS